MTPTSWFSGVSMSRTARRKRTESGPRPSLEWLEARWLRDGSMATIATNGASWNASDNTVTVDFNQPYLDGVLLPGDVVVVPENPNNPTPLLSDPNYVDTSTDTYSSIQVSNPPLAPGVYDIVLQADPYSTESVWSMNGPLTLGTFTILPPAATPLPATLSTAASLGTVGPQMQSIAGTLDLASQQNVDLYQITLGPGHFWRLGVQLEAQQIGSPLQGALSLFDSNGNVLATSNSGTGGLNSPADPYLFSGLSRGVYYVGVSGANNIPGQPGGYDPRGSGRFGTSGDQQAGGNYTLDLFADQADTPTEVLGAQLQWGDPLGPSPTGLTLDFSNSIDINSLNAAMTIPSAFVVVDQSGHLWSLSPTPYNAGNAQLNLVFAQPLPAGQYRLLNSSSDGLKDLAGWSPVAPGLPPGILATWTVRASTPPVVPGYLGTVWPSLQSGVGDSELILPEQIITSQVYIPIQGFYTLETVSPRGMLGVEQAGPGGLVLIDPGSQGASHQYTLDLQPGVYLFTFRNSTPEAVVADWKIVLSSIDDEYYTNNGVGQSVALSLRLVSPITPVPLTISQPGSSPSQGSTATLIGSFTPTGVAPTLTGLPSLPTDVTPISAGLFLSSNSGLLGVPSAGAVPIETVESGIAVSGNSMAGGTLDIRPGISDRWYGTNENANFVQSGQNAPTPDVALASSHLPPEHFDPTESSTADALALSKSDRIVELAGAARALAWGGTWDGESEYGPGPGRAGSACEKRNGNRPGPGSRIAQGSTGTDGRG